MTHLRSIIHLHDPNCQIKKKLVAKAHKNLQYRAGRLVNTSFREVDPTHCVIDMEDAGSFNHIVVFLTG